MSYVDQPIAWTRTGDGEYPFQACHAGATLHLRVNDFPAEPLYTLLVDYRPSVDLEDWPPLWLRPGPTPDELRAAGTAQLRRGRVDAIVIADWAHRLCTAPPGPAVRIRAALDLPTVPSPSLAGLTRLEIVEAAGVAGLTRLEFVEAAGVVIAVHLTPSGGGPTTAELTTLLGAGFEDGPSQVVFRVTLPDAPFSCEVVAFYPAGPLAPSTLVPSTLVPSTLVPSTLAPSTLAPSIEVQLRRHHANRGR